MEEKETSESILPGPTPDPSKIPSVVREVGQLDIEGKIEELGIAKISNPIISELIEFFEETEPPEPLSNNLSGDPQSEAWLQLLLTLMIKEHGKDSASLGEIELIIGEKMNREGSDLELFLNRLWMMGRIDKVYGGAEVAFSPNPSWLESR